LNPDESVPLPEGVQVSIVDVGRIVPAADNVRRRDARAKKHLYGSVKQFGPARSISLDADGICRAGNGTMEAFVANGGSEVIVVVPKPGQLVAVQNNHWSHAEAVGYAIADNRASELSEFDKPALLAQINALDLDGIDRESLGFNDLEIEAMQCEVDGFDDGEEEEDNREIVDVEKWMIVIDCNDENHQVELLERFKTEGLICRAFIS
jgi:hypothetical protein